MDAYHLVDTDSADEILAFVAEQLPQHVHLFVSTRMDPALPLARLRARCLMTEIRAVDLRFDHAEAGEFLGEEPAGEAVRLMAPYVADLESLDAADAFHDPQCLTYTAVNDPAKLAEPTRVSNSAPKPVAAR